MSKTPSFTPDGGYLKARRQVLKLATRPPAGETLFYTWSRKNGLFAAWSTVFTAQYQGAPDAIQNAVEKDVDEHCADSVWGKRLNVMLWLMGATSLGLLLIERTRFWFWAPLAVMFTLFLGVHLWKRGACRAYGEGKRMLPCDGDALKQVNTWCQAAAMDPEIKNALEDWAYPGERRMHEFEALRDRWIKLSPLLEEHKKRLHMFEKRSQDYQTSLMSLPLKQSYEGRHLDKDTPQASLSAPARSRM